jgi:hypothetical protein
MFEEWHRRAHGWGPNEGSQQQSPSTQGSHVWPRRERAASANTRRSRGNLPGGGEKFYLASGLSRSMVLTSGDGAMDRTHV